MGLQRLREPGCPALQGTLHPLHLFRHQPAFAWQLGWQLGQYNGFSRSSDWMLGHFSRFSQVLDTVGRSFSNVKSHFLRLRMPALH